MANGRSGAVALAGPADKTWDDFVKCEIEHGDQHEVHPHVWPPPQVGMPSAMPSMALRCVRCTTNCIVYAGHAIPAGEPGHMDGIKVVLPEKKKSA